MVDAEFHAYENTTMFEVSTIYNVVALRDYSHRRN